MSSGLFRFCLAQMYPAKVLKDGPAEGGKHLTLDEMILEADGFAGVFPEHKYEIVKRLQGLGHLCAMVRCVSGYLRRLIFSVDDPIR